MAAVILMRELGPFVSWWLQCCAMPFSACSHKAGLLVWSRCIAWEQERTWPANPPR